MTQLRILLLDSNSGARDLAPHGNLFSCRVCEQNVTLDKDATGGPVIPVLAAGFDLSNV